MTLGKILRKLRKDKKITLGELSTGNLSISQISRFERGESEITCKSLISLLETLHITLDEFVILSNNDNDYKKMIKEVRQKCKTDNCQNIYKTYSKQGEIKSVHFEEILLKSILYKFDKEFLPTPLELDELTEYLFSIDYWTSYEIILLGNTSELLNFDTVFLLTKEMIKYSRESNLVYNKQLVIQLAINCLIVSIENKKQSNSKFLISEISCLLKDELLYYEKTVFLYACGFYEFFYGNKEIKKMQNALKIFAILNEETYYKNFSEHYFEHVTSNKSI
ncbi:helix-turn-helix domain-containing protein [Streptococcus agalactiae]|uniref:helix-turn-helix domain-containing protein n=1 Tax=Streptococcus agalactiae TaxID=1311 RepID=UPI001374D173|nr:Rgg/GadR/MutR family transcriptional regulator [Streptococcus agalactiae]KAF1101646.1 hypothetical protein B8U81_09760 [Streptococcus agalactiae]KAF1201005.1 hypothetical protein B8V53_01335 [Streptococcus agalactiae]MCD0086681.1 helix-turn-helix domain-containing protein [Streptococcus agalactiae]MCD0107598.1 helix-turn-helix domain-containing protein [Streptococcus agalactiae]HEM9292925.1 helix-turn-helix domain-containing protein [Streptococcus agalactiae]